MEELRMVKGLITYRADVDHLPDLNQIVDDYAGDGFAMLVTADKEYATLLLRTNWLKRFDPGMRIVVAGDYLAPRWGADSWQRTSTETGWFFKHHGGNYLSGWRFRTVTFKDLRKNWSAWEDAMNQTHETTVKVHWL